MIAQMNVKMCAMYGVCTSGSRRAAIVRVRPRSATDRWCVWRDGGCTYEGDGSVRGRRSDNGQKGARACRNGNPVTYRTAEDERQYPT